MLGCVGGGGGAGKGRGEGEGERENEISHVADIQFKHLVLQLICFDFLKTGINWFLDWVEIIRGMLWLICYTVSPYLKTYYYLIHRQKTVYISPLLCNE